MLTFKIAIGIFNYMITTKNQTVTGGTWNDGFPEILVYLDYSYLPVRTFVEVHNTILQVHDYLIELFDLDKEDIFKWYQFQVTELQTGNSSWIKLEFNFHFPDKKKKDGKLMKAIRRFAFVAGLLGLIISGQEIYLNSLRIENEKNKLEQTMPAETIREAQKLNLNVEKLDDPETRRYISSVKKQLAAAVSDDNIRSLQINGHELKRAKPKLRSGSFDL